MAEDRPVALADVEAPFGVEQAVAKALDLLPLLQALCAAEPDLLLQLVREQVEALDRRVVLSGRFDVRGLLVDELLLGDVATFPARVPANREPRHERGDYRADHGAYYRFHTA